MSDMERNPLVDAPLTEPEIEMMLRGFLRHERLFTESLRAGMSADHFATHPTERRFYVLLGSMQRLHEQHGTLTKTMLIHDIAGMVVNNTASLSLQELTLLIGDTETNTVGLIEEAFESPKLDEEKENAERNYAESILRRFLNSRLIRASLQDLLNRTQGDTAPVNIDKVLDSFCQKSQRVRHVGTKVENAAMLPVFNDASITLPPPPDPTNIQWIDTFIGGIRPGDLLGVLAPFGGGKTTMLISATVRIAENYHLTNQNKLSVFIGFEDGADKTKHLCWSAATHIERKLFSFDETSKFWEHFSTSANLKPYEFDLPENHNGKILLGERERWEAAAEWYNKNFVYLDFAHSHGNRSMGGGGPSELAEALHKLQEERKMEIGFIAIDYAGLMIERMVAADNISAMAKVQESMWRYIKTLPDQLRRHVADQFNASVLIAHQLAPGDIRTYPPTKFIHHHDSQGGKSFAENLHACFCLGVRDVDTKVCTLNWSKIRAFMPPSTTALVKIHDHYVDVNVVTDKFRVCSGTRKILDKRDQFPAIDGIASEPRIKSDDFDSFTNNFM
jgi:hypothetical protein